MINLTELFEVQRKLDAEIEQKHPVQPGEDRLAKRILALQVELGECANEWRGFKFWSTDQEPRTETRESIVGTDETGSPYDSYEIKNPLLEEYVDCLHFILSIGLEIGESYFYIEPQMMTEKDITSQFSATLNYAYLLKEDDFCSELFTSFYQLGEMLGFTWQQIETAYMSKNATNWERQANGY